MTTFQLGPPVPLGLPLPMRMPSAVSWVRVSPRNWLNGAGFGTRGISASHPKQLCFWMMHNEKRSNSGLSYDAMQR